MQRAVAQGGPGPFRTSRETIRAGTENFGSYSEYYGKLLEGSSRGATGAQVASEGSFCCSFGKRWRVRSLGAGW